jgi:DnaK suppressor protein
MAAEPYRRLQELMRERREELETGLRELRSSMADTTPVDLNEMQTATDSGSDAEIWATTVEITARTLQSIEHALRRLRTGGYGSCAECGADIPAARLRAMPFAVRCRPCQELVDAETMPLAG